MIDLYAWKSANGRRPLIMLEETGTPYNITAIDPHGPESKAPEYLAISPGGKVPCLVEPDAEGGEPITIMESSAILLYLAEKTGQFGGDTPRRRWEVNQWLLYGATNVAISFSALNVSRDMEDQCRTLLAVLERRLGEVDYFAGEYSIADMMSIGRFGDFRFDFIDLNEFPNLCRWRDRMLARPAVKKAMEMKIG